MPTYHVEAKKLGTVQVEADGFKIEGPAVIFYKTYDDGHGTDVGLVPLEGLQCIYDASLIHASEKKKKKDK